MNAPLCKTCSTSLYGKYCHACGEKIVNPEKEYSLKHHVEEFIEGIFHFDNKFFSSFKLLVSKPGFLTAEYLEGRRVKYVKPLHLFLVLVLIMAFVPGRYTFIAQSLPTLLTYPAVLINKNLPEKVLAKKAWDQQTLNENFKKDFNQLAKPFSVVYIFIIALLFWVITGVNRKYFAENLIAAIHFYCFIIIVVLSFFLVLQIMTWLHLDTWMKWLDSNDRSLILFLFSFGWFCYHLFKRVHKLPTWRAFISSILMFVLVMATLLFLRTSFYHLIMYKYLL